jgi:hypothetical protein
MPSVQIYTVVIFGAVGLFIVIGVLSTFTRPSSIYDQIGRGELSLEGEADGSGAHAGAPEGADPEREREIRQMLLARSERLVRRGEAPLDIDAELAKLAAPAGAAQRDPELAAEVRQLVIARNERRRRRGLEALDVEAEVRRTLAELDPGGSQQV